MLADVKLLEVRDAGTCIPIVAIRYSPLEYSVDERDVALWSAEEPFAEKHMAEEWLWRRGGWDLHSKPIYIHTLPDPVKCGYSDTHFTSTLSRAHDILSKDWDAFQSADVLDVEFELGETTVKKLTDRLYKSPSQESLGGLTGHQGAD